MKCVEQESDVKMEVDEDQTKLPNNKTVQNCDRNPLKYEVNTILHGEIILSSSTDLEKCANQDLLYIEIRVKGEKLRQIDLSRHPLINESEKPVFVLFKDLEEVTFYWRACKSDNFHLLSISEAPNKNVVSFCENFLIDEIIKGRNGILRSSKDKKVINIRDIGNSRGCDLQRMAVMLNDVNLVQSLQKFNLSVDSKDDDGCLPIDSAWSIYCNSKHNDERKKSNEIMMILLEAGSRNPMKIKDISKEFVYEDASEEVRNFLNNKQQWHDYAEDDDLDSLKMLFEESPNYYRHCFNSNNRSLMMTAVDSDNNEILDFLSNHGCCIGSHEVEEFRIIMKQKAGWMKKRHTKRIKLDAHKNPSGHLYILEASSIIVNSVPNFEKYWSQIRQALRFLDKNETCSLILQLAATVNNLTIEFDFELDTACYMVPTRSVESVGCNDRNGGIYIAGKDLLNEERKYEVYGVIIHEFCHVAVNLTYMNGSQPYQVGESIEKKLFRQKVVKQCENNKEGENLINIAFDVRAKNLEEYEDIRDCELIVRQIHIMIHYFLSPDKIQLCKDKFDKIFNYFETIVVNDMKVALQLIPKLNDNEEIVKFEDLTNPMKVKIYHSKVKFHGVENIFQKIIKNFQKFENILKINELRSESIKDCLLHNKAFHLTELNTKIKEQGCKFINRKFILSDLFEKEENDEKDFKNVEEIIECVKNSKAFILADESGAGKTLTLENMKQYLQDKNFYNDHWISSITLKDHEEYFLKNINQNLDDRNVMSILRTVQNLNPDIESEIFNIMFENGKVIFIFDGFDEICPQLKEFFIGLLKKIKENIIKIENGQEIEKNNNDNQIWISTRLQHKEALEIALNVKAFKHEPLSRADIENLIIEIYNKHKKDDQKEMKTVLSDFNKFFEIMNNSSRKMSDSFDLNNPLMITIVAELYANDDIELNIESLNLFNIFEKITEKVRKAADLKVNVDDKDPTLTDFTLGHVYQVLSLMYLYPYDLIKDLSIMKQWEHVNIRWKAERIQKFGFLHLDPEFDNDPLCYSFIHFTHRSYAEFFLAQFLISFFKSCLKIDDEDLKNILKNISKGIISGNIFKFILSAMQNDKNTKINNEENLNKVKNWIIKTKNNFEEEKEADHFQRFQNTLNYIFLIKDEIVFKFLCFLLLNNRKILEDFFLSKTEPNFLEFVLLKGNLYFVGIRTLIEVLEIVFGLEWDTFFVRTKTKKKYKFNENNLPKIYSNRVDKINQKTTLKLLEYIENEFNAAERLSIYKKHIVFWFSDVINNEILEHMLLRMNEITSDEEKEFTKIMHLFIKSSGIEDKMFLKNKLDQILENNQQINSNIASKSYCYLIHNIFKNINNKEYENKKNENEYLNNSDIFIHSDEIKNELRTIFTSKKLPIDIFYNFAKEDSSKFQKHFIEVFKDNLEELEHCFDYKDGYKIFINEENFTKFQNFISNFNNEELNKKIFRSILFYSGYGFGSPLTLQLRQNTNFFQKIVSLYQKYKETNEEVQDYLTSEKYIFENLISRLSYETYPIAMKFLKKVFYSNKTKLIELLLNIKIPSDSITNKENFDCLKKLLSEFLNNDEIEIKKYIKKYLLILFEKFDFVLLRNITSNASEFRRLINLLLHYFENSYDELQKIISNKNILLTLIFNKTDETCPILIEFVKTVFKSDEVSLSRCFPTDSNCVKELFENKEKMKLFEQFLNEILNGNEEKIKIICQDILRQHIEEIMFNAIKSEEKIENLKYFFKTFNFSNKEFQNYINIIKIFENLDMKMYQTVKDFLFEVFSENKEDLIACVPVPCNYINHLLYNITNLKLLEEFINEFFDVDKSLVDKCMRKILYYDYDYECIKFCKHFYFYSFEGSESTICKEKYPLIWIFFDEYIEDIPSFINLYKKYKESWNWIQALFIYLFPFELIEFFSKNTYKLFKEFISEAFKSKTDSLRNHIIESYQEVLESESENCVDFCNAFNLIHLNDLNTEESSDEEMPSTSYQNQSEIKPCEINFDEIKMADLQRLFYESSSDDE